MKNDTKEKRMLDILDRLANGEISPQKADELLKQADYADENGQGGAADGGNYENAAKMNAEGGPDGAEEALLAVAEEYFPQDDDDDDDDEEYGEYEEAEDIISGVTPDNVLAVCMELAELDEDAAAAGIAACLPLIKDNEGNFDALLEILEDFGENIEYPVLEQLLGRFCMSPERMGRLAGAVQDMEDGVRQNVLNICAAALGTGRGAGNGGRQGESRAREGGKAADPSWENVWRDAMAKDAAMGRSAAFPSYEAVSIELPKREYEHNSVSINGRCEGKTSARRVSVEDTCRAQDIDAERLEVSGSLTAEGEVRCDRINISAEAEFDGRACFDRLCVSGKLTARDLLVGNSVTVSGRAAFDDVQARVMHISGKAAFGGEVKGVSLTATGQADFCDTVRISEISLSGRAGTAADVHCAKLNVNGEFTAQREVWASDVINVNGKAEFALKPVFRRLYSNGMLQLKSGAVCNRGVFASNGKCICQGGIEDADCVDIKGSIQADYIGAPLNWTRAVDINMKEGGSRVETITARTTRVSALDDSRLRAGTISGYSVDVKNTDADCLKGNYVAVGKGCRIGLVQYVNAVQLDPAAEVERVEKISPN